MEVAEITFFCSLFFSSCLCSPGPSIILLIRSLFRITVRSSSTLWTWTPFARLEKFVSNIKNLQRSMKGNEDYLTDCVFVCVEHLKAQVSEPRSVSLWRQPCPCQQCQLQWWEMHIKLKTKLDSCIQFPWIHLVFFSPSGPDSPYTKTALEIVNVCKQTLAEVCVRQRESFAVHCVYLGFLFMFVSVCSSCVSMMNT